jgi:tRNA (cytidine32/guanosine34-2'-O)-methyltransferase
MGRASKDKRDIYYRRAKEEGYRARSAYKLLQIHEEFNILDPREIRTGAVDLCAAPGSWSQVLAHHFKTLATSAAATGASSPSPDAPPPPPRVVAVDLQEMAPIEGVHILQGDITSAATANEIIRLLNEAEEGSSGSGGPRHGAAGVASSSTSLPSAAAAATTVVASPRKADIVICDGAPDVTGMHELDEYLQHHLLLAALHITTFILRPGGCFVTKMFRGPNTPFLVAKSEVFFEQVRVVKPKSSRNASMESFLLCQGFRLPPGYVPRFLDAAANTTTSISGISSSSSSIVSHPTGEAGTVTREKGGSSDALRSSGFTPDAPIYHYATATAARTACTLPSRVLAPFLSCGDLSAMDADMCYDRAADTTVLEPVQPPLQAPYLSAAAANSSVDTASSEAEKKKRVKVEVPP